MRMRRDIGLDRLRKGKDHLRTLGRVAQQQLIVDVAEIASLEEHRGGVGAAKDMEGGEAVRIGPKLDSPCGLVDQA